MTFQTKIISLQEKFLLSQKSEVLGILTPAIYPSHILSQIITYYYLFSFLTTSNCALALDDILFL